MPILCTKQPRQYAEFVSESFLHLQLCSIIYIYDLYTSVSKQQVLL